MIGDSCVDRFVYGNCDRICPEAPVPIMNPTNGTTNGGMAKNVQRNISSLGVACDILTNESIIIKTRYVDNKTNQILLRIDENDKCDNVEINRLKNLEKYDAIVISDYCKGFLTEDNISYICDQNNNVFIDTKKKFGKWITKASFVKINQYEYEYNKFLIEELSSELFEKLIVTYGDKGCVYKDKTHPPFGCVEVKDLSGAGDTFLAAFAVNYTKTKDVISSIDFAQQCASEIVKKKGVATI